MLAFHWCYLSCSSVFVFPVDWSLPLEVGSDSDLRFLQDSFIGGTGFFCKQVPNFWMFFFL